MKKLKPIEIYLPIYRCAIVIFFEYSAEEMKKFGLKRNIKEETLPRKWIRDTESVIEEKIGGFATNFGEKNRDVLVWVKNIPRTSTEYGVLYHELYHAVDLVFFGIDQNTLGYNKDGMSEPRAYLYQYIINECNRILWNLPKEKGTSRSHKSVRK